jgi:hypothetical protein
MRTSASRLIGIAGFICAVVSGVPSPAQAGPVEQFVQVLWHDAKPERLALRYDNAGGGLLVSDDGGRTFALVCAAATGASDLRGSTALMDGEGRLWLAAFDGVAHDDASACSWTRDPALAKIWVSDIVAHPTRPDVRYAISSAPEPMPNGVYRSEGEGGFAPIGRLDDAFPTRLRIARRGDGVRFYESAVHGTSMQATGNGPALVANYVIRYSDDDAEHWTEHLFPTKEGIVRLVAVDPTNAERIVISVSSTALTTLYVSSDSGATFEPYFDVAALGGFAITAEGRVYVGDAGDNTGARKTRGLWVAESLDEPARLLSDAYNVQCLGYRESDSTLFVCDRFKFGVADLETGAFSQRVSLTNVQQMVECSDRDVRQMCRQQLLDGYCGTTHFPCAPVCDAYGVDLRDLYSAAELDPSLAACFSRRDPTWRPAVNDAGSPADAGAAGSAPSDERRPDAGAVGGKHVEAGCNVARGVGGTGASSYVVLLLMAAAIWRLRSRSRSRTITCTCTCT